MNDPREPEDLGDPIAELRLLDEAPPEGFLPRVRNSIQRRVFAGQVVDFGLRPLGEFFMEYVVMLVSAFAPASSASRRSDDER